MAVENESSKNLNGADLENQQNTIYVSDLRKELVKHPDLVKKFKEARGIVKDIKDEDILKKFRYNTITGEPIDSVATFFEWMRQAIEADKNWKNKMSEKDPILQSDEKHFRCPHCDEMNLTNSNICWACKESISAPPKNS